MNTIAFDIDGTVINVWRRYWGIYAQHLEAHDEIPLPIDTYKAEVRKGVENFRLFRQWHSEALYDSYISFRRSKLEDLEYLRQDVIASEIAPALEYLAVNFRLIAVSARDEASNLRRQLNWLGIESFFSTVNATGLYGGPAAKVRILQSERAAMIIGDTEVDLQAATQAGIAAVPVSWGLRDSDFMRSRTNFPVVADPDELVKRCIAICGASP